jgi:hypothetical protein
MQVSEILPVCDVFRFCGGCEEDEVER